MHFEEHSTKVYTREMDMFEGHSASEVHELLETASPMHMKPAHGQYGRVALGAPHDILSHCKADVEKNMIGVNFFVIWHDWYVYDEVECKQQIKTHKLRTCCANKSQIWEHDEVQSNADTVSVIFVLGDNSGEDSGVSMLCSTVNPDQHNCWLQKQAENYQHIPACYDKEAVQQNIQEVKIPVGKYIVQKGTTFRPEHFLKIKQKACVMHFYCVQGEQGATSPFSAIPPTSTKLIEAVVGRTPESQIKHRLQLAVAVGRLLSDKQGVDDEVAQLLTNSTHLYTAIEERQPYTKEMSRCRFLVGCGCGCQSYDDDVTRDTQSATSAATLLGSIYRRALRNQSQCLLHQQADRRTLKRQLRQKNEELYESEQELKQRRSKLFVKGVDGETFDLMKELTNRFSAKHLPDWRYVQNENTCSITCDPLGFYNGVTVEIRAVLCNNSIQFYNQQGILGWIVKQAGGDWDLERTVYDGATGFKFMNASECCKQPSDPNTNASISARSAEEMMCTLTERLSEAHLQRLKKHSPWLQEITRFANPETRPTTTKMKKRTRSSGDETAAPSDWRQICKRNTCLFAQGKLAQHMGGALCERLRPVDAIDITWLLRAPTMQSMSRGIAKLTEKYDGAVEKEKQTIIAQYLQ